MPKQLLLTFFSKRKVLVFLSSVGVLGAMLILLGRNGSLTPRISPIPPTQLDFSKVVGMPAPRSTIILKSGVTDSLADPIDWLSFTVSQADLSRIIKFGRFQINWSMVPGLSVYPTPKELSHRGKYLVFSDRTDAPTWWKPAHTPGHYILYQKDIEFEDVSTLRVLAVTPGSNIVYAAYSRPF